MKDVKAAAAARSSKGKKKDMKTQYTLWIGGTCGAIVAAVLLLLWNPDKTPFEMAVNDEQLISYINKNSKSWKAGASPNFEGWSIGDVKTLQGISVAGTNIANCQVSEVEVPEEFDARQKWSQCFSAPIYQMGNCSASWAIATASALSNRFCIADPTTHGELILSPQQLLSCDRANRGCEGGDVDGAWNYMMREGLVSEVCFPYQADAGVSCESKCTTEAPLKAASHCALSDVKSIKQELVANGPVVGLIAFHDDFLVYKNGVYDKMATATSLTDRMRNRILHAVKIVGFGKEDGKDYWVVENSFGEDWGESGYMKLTASGDEEGKGILIETFAVAGTPSSTKVEEALADDEEDPDQDLDLDEEEAV